MALMFSRLAHNFAKNGYFPTDEATLERCLQALDTSAQQVSMLDPCCGEGVALAECKRHFEEAGTTTRAFGVEYNKERAWHAKELLDVVAHADIHDMAIKVRQFGLLFLNPPYGDLVTDTAGLSDKEGGRQKFEKVFFQKAHPWLAFDGILILIIPHYVLDAEFSSWIAKSYSDVRVFMAPEQKFKQCVIFGKKRKADRLDAKLAERLAAIGAGDLPPELPEHWTDSLYAVPEALGVPHFVAARLNAEELVQELDKVHKSTLWPQFKHRFGGQVSDVRPPLRQLSDWHLALALAAGQISGVVTSSAGRVLLIKGDTFKAKTEKVTYEETGNKDGDMREIRTFTDSFVPCIRAFDFSPDSALYGHLVTIQ